MTYHLSSAGSDISIPISALTDDIPVRFKIIKDIVIVKTRNFNITFLVPETIFTQPPYETFIPSNLTLIIAYFDNISIISKVTIF
jgi:hypothetical protein